MFLVPSFANILQDSHELELGENTQRALWSLKVTFFSQESESGLKESLAVHSALANVPLTYMCVCVCVFVCVCVRHTACIQREPGALPLG